MEQELRQELEAIGIKIKESTENFVFIRKMFWKAKQELAFLEVMKKHDYTLKREEMSDYTFEKCKN